MTPTVLADGGLYYQGGCRVHGTSIVLPEDEEAETLFPQPVTKNGGHRGLTETMRRRSQNSVCSSPLASPVPPLGPAPPYDHSNCSDRMHKSCACVNFIAEHTKAREEATKVRFVDDETTFYMTPALKIFIRKVNLHCLRHDIEFLPFTAFFSNCRIC